MNNNIGTFDNKELTKDPVNEIIDLRELNEIPIEEITKHINEKIIPFLDSIKKYGDNTEVINPSVYYIDGIASMISEKLEN